MEMENYHPQPDVNPDGIPVNDVEEKGIEGNTKFIKSDGTIDFNSVVKRGRPKEYNKKGLESDGTQTPKRKPGRPREKWNAGDINPDGTKVVSGECVEDVDGNKPYIEPDGFVIESESPDIDGNVAESTDEEKAA